MFTTRSSAVALAAVATFAFSAPDAKAQSVMSGVIRNDLPVTVAYQISVNNGPWTTFTLAPKGVRPHWTRVPGTNVRIRFDNRLSDGRLTFTTQQLLLLGTNSANSGWLQVFMTVNDGKDVVLRR